LDNTGALQTYNSIILLYKQAI